MSKAMTETTVEEISNHRNYYIGILGIIMAIIFFVIFRGMRKAGWKSWRLLGPNPGPFSFLFKSFRMNYLAYDETP